jgi:sulfide:quinone oxidoreductase
MVGPARAALIRAAPRWCCGFSAERVRIRENHGSACAVARMCRGRPPGDSPPMSREPMSSLRVLVAGAGVAGLETLVVLRALAGERVAATLIAPDDAFAVRALDVFEPFGVGRSHRYPLDELAAELGVTRERDSIARVDATAQRVRLRSGRELDYDALVVAVGALPYPAFDHGVVFDRARSPEPFDRLLADVQSGRARSVAVVVPAGTTWALPAYELALMLRSLGGAGRAPRPAVTLVSAEREPLAAFGAPAGEMIRSELHASGVDLVCGVTAGLPSDRLVTLGHGRALHAARIVHLPLLAGPRLAGLPYDTAGFVLADADLTVDGDEAVFAIGDGAAGPFKQGGLAAQQADAVAERIAFRAGAPDPPRPYAPALRGLLRTEHGPRYLRAEPPGGAGECLVSDQCLWWPPSKVASRWLTPWLAARETSARSASPRVLPSGGVSRGSWR